MSQVSQVRPRAGEKETSGHGRRARPRRRPVLRQLPTHLILIPLCLVWIYPFVWMLATGLKSTSEFYTSGLSIIPDQPAFENFARAWDTAHFGQYTFNSIVIAVSVASLEVALAAMAGYALGRGNIPGKKLIVAALVITMFLPRGYTILPVFILVNSLGLNNSLLGIIVAESGAVGVIAVLLFMGYFHQLPQELDDSGRVDGAGFWRIFLQIMLPLAKPVAATVFIFNFISAWNSFLIPLVFTLGAPDLRTTGVGMYNFAGETTVDFTGLAAAAVISVVPVIVVFLLLQRYFIEGLAGAVKR
jgi:ABC-type glycerol-3-phosphate transport system permease component